MTDVEIEYCVPCGHLPRAQELQKALLEEFGRTLDGVRLKTGDGGTFIVRVDGDPIFDVDDETYDVDQITDRVGGRIGATA